MGCVFNYPAKLIKGLSSFGPKGEETDNSKLIREMGEDLVNAISYVGDSRMDQFVVVHILMVLACGIEYHYIQPHYPFEQL